MPTCRRHWIYSRWLSVVCYHRIVKAFFGESLGAYVNRLRMENALWSLRYSEDSIQTIAYSVGYDSPASFTKVFKQHYGVSPSVFRKNPKCVKMKQEQEKKSINLKGPKLQEVSEKTALYIRATGNYSELDYGGAWGKLWGCVKTQQLFAKGIEHFCVFHDDPNMTATDKLLTDICLVLTKPAQPEGEIGVRTIAGGKYAVFLYQRAL